MPKTHRNQKSILNDGETPGFPVGRAMCEDFMEREGGLSSTDVVGGAPQDEGIGKVRRKVCELARGQEGKFTVSF